MRIIPNPPRFIHSDRNIGFRFIEPQAHFFQLYRKFILLLNNLKYKNIRLFPHPGPSKPYHTLLQPPRLDGLAPCPPRPLR